jgi:hypothetical protein
LEEFVHNVLLSEYFGRDWLGEFVHTLLLSEYFDGDWLGEFGKS